MGSGVRLGSIAGIEIRLDYSWFLVFALLAWSLSVGLFPRLGFPGGMGWLLGIVAALLLFVSVLIHEISHSLVARRFGIDVSGITLFLFGGVAQIKDEPPSPKAEFFIAGIGPVVSVAIGVVCLVIAGALRFLDVTPALVALFGYLGIINIVLAVFNLVPGFPLDGGRLLRAAVWHFTGNLRKATRWAANGGQLFAWLLIGFGIFRLLAGDWGGLWLIFIGWFLNNAAQAAYQQLLLRRALSGIRVSEVMTTDTPTVDADLRVPEFVENYLLRYDYSLYPVCREGDFVGVVTVDDVRRLERDHWGVTAVGALAHPPAEERTVKEDEDAWDALTQMMENNAPRLLVMRDGQLEGVVSRDSIIRLVQRKMQLGLSR